MKSNMQIRTEYTAQNRIYTIEQNTLHRIEQILIECNSRIEQRGIEQGTTNCNMQRKIYSVYRMPQSGMDKREYNKMTCNTQINTQQDKTKRVEKCNTYNWVGRIRQSRCSRIEYSTWNRVEQNEIQYSMHRVEWN